MQNVGLRNVPPPVDEFNLPNFQALPQIEGVNSVGKGYNVYVLYGELSVNEQLGIYPAYYYLYVGMSIDNGAGELITTDGVGRGLFFRNDILENVEGFFCERNSQAMYNWECQSTNIAGYYFRPDEARMPLNRETTSWWTCGAEDFNTYT